MLSMPAIVENDFSSGVATVAAIVCGLVPGSVAVTVIVGKSTFGRSLTGRFRYDTIPKTRMPIMTRVVMTGRLMKRVVKFMGSAGRGRRSVREAGLERAALGGVAARATEPRLQFVEISVEHRRDEQRHDLRENETANDGDSQRTARRGARAHADRDRQCAHDR